MFLTALAAVVVTLLAQAQPAPQQGLRPETIFYLTLLFIFLTAIITAVATKWSKDKCLKFFRGYHVTLERARGQTIWGQLKVFSSGLEVVYDHPFVNVRGRKKTTSLFYGQDVDTQLLSLLRYDAELTDAQREQRRQQIHATFNPGPLKRLWRKVRNFVNTLRDAFGAAIGAAVGQFQKMNPSSALSSQSGSVTQIGQTLLGKFANAYEPLLEQYIGQPVILDVADPINPNNATVEYTGYLADYTQQFIAVFNVEHKTGDTFELELPDVERGDPLPPLPGPPPPGAPAPVLPTPVKTEHECAVRLDGPRMKIQNLRYDPVVVRCLTRDGFEPLDFGCVIPPSATLDLPARDARGGRLRCEVAKSVDVVAPRRLATVRHAGELVERKGLVQGVVNDFHLDALPLVPKLFRSGYRREGNGVDEVAEPTEHERARGE